jgi:hypothetical protein
VPPLLLSAKCWVLATCRIVALGSGVAVGGTVVALAVTTTVLVAPHALRAAITSMAATKDGRGGRVNERMMMPVPQACWSAATRQVARRRDAWRARGHVTHTLALEAKYS